MADFVLGRLKFKWRGDWGTSTAYLIDDIIKYGGNTYVCVTNHTSAAATADFYTDLNSNSYWELQGESLFFKGDWAGSTFYKLNDLVKYGTYQYRCTTQHTSTSTFDATKFQVYAEGLQFEDSYDPSTVYQKGDVVTYGGYSYVAAETTVSGVTPIASASEWDLLNPGFEAAGDYQAGTAYETGQVVNFGGYAFVCTVNTTAGTPPTNGSFWRKIVEGIKWNDTYAAGTTYYQGDAVRYSSSSYISVADGHTGVTPGTDATKWQLIAQGDTGAVLTTRGDIIVQDASQTTRLPIGVSGSILTTDGTDPIWSNAEGANVKWVANSGSDSNPGTQALPYKTLNYALKQATSADVVELETTTNGGTGGTPGTYDASQTSTSGSGTGFTIRAITDGSSAPSIVITNGGSGYAEGDTITISGSQLGTPSAATDLTVTVKSVSVGDVIYVKNGVYKENLPLRVPAGVTVQGESLRGTEIRPASSTGSQIATVTTSSTISGATDGTYNYIHQSSTTSTLGAGVVANITIASGVFSSITIYHGGYHYETSDTIDFDVADIGCGGTGTLTATVASLENNNASNMFLVNNQTNITQMSMRFLTGTPTAGGTSRAAVISLDPEGKISSVSPYIQNCTSFNTNNTGIQIDGNLHANLSSPIGNRSILANDFTQINSDGIGVHALGKGRGEMVSIFTYYCNKSFFAESGGFIRGLNCSSAYGEQGAVAEGTSAGETPVTVNSRGEHLVYQPATIVGGSNTTSEFQAGQTITGNTSGATATVFRYQISTDTMFIENRTGNFQQSETLTVTRNDSSTFTVNASADIGDSTAAQIGQKGFIIAVDSSDGTLGSTEVIIPGSNIQFAGDSTYYRVSTVTDEDTSNERAIVRLTLAVTEADSIADNTSTTITTQFSNVRLTGHDFLDIGTGDFVTTNYPGTPTQPADQDDEVVETNGGRVYFSSSDQKGDFRVGDLFRIEQATGIATLNADAFDLSGLSELQLGSIGAEIGATINEFSTDQTLGGNSTTAVPTEYAVKGYLERDYAGTGAWVPPTGTTAQRPTGVALYTGAIRYNSSLVTWEGYNGTQWTGLGGGNPWSTFTADGSTALTVAANDRYFIDTTAAAQTVTLPASPQTGDQVSFIDLAGTFDTNNLTIARNSLKIMGLDEDMTVSQENAGLSLVYSGATYGWKLINN